MIDVNKTINAGNILLRPIRIGDFEEMFSLTCDATMWTYFTSDLSNEVVLRNWIDSAINDENRLALTLVDVKLNQIIGSTSIGNVSVRDKRSEIGWTWLGKDYQGKGYNKQVKCALMKYLFEECLFERVEFKTDVLNVPARKALGNMGLVEEGVLRSHTLMADGRRRDTIFYSSLKSDWEKIKERNDWS